MGLQKKGSIKNCQKILFQKFYKNLDFYFFHLIFFSKYQPIVVKIENKNTILTYFDKIYIYVTIIYIFYNIDTILIDPSLRSKKYRSMVWSRSQSRSWSAISSFKAKNIHSYIIYFQLFCCPEIELKSHKTCFHLE